MSENKSESQVKALISIGGEQHFVAPGDVIEVNLPRNTEVGSTVKADKVLLLLSDVSKKGQEISQEVSLTVKGLVKTPKVIIFKKKRRKGYTKTQGHRQVKVQAQVNSF